MALSELPTYEELNHSYDDYILDIKTLKTNVRNKSGYYVEIDEVPFFDASLLSKEFEIIKSIIYIKNIVETFPSVYFSFSFTKKTLELTEDRIKKLEHENRCLKDQLRSLILTSNSTSTVMNYDRIILTPISKTYNKKPPCSKKDYDEQKLRVKNGKSLMWDDTPNNKSKAGDIFIFVHNRTKLEVHTITKVMNYTDRLITWTRDKNHEKRNVLILNSEPIIISIDDVKSLKYDIRGSVVLQNEELKKEIVYIIKNKLNMQIVPP